MAGQSFLEEGPRLCQTVGMGEAMQGTRGVGLRCRRKGLVLGSSLECRMNTGNKKGQGG